MNSFRAVLSIPGQSRHRGVRSTTVGLGLLLVWSFLGCGRDEPPAAPTLDESSSRTLSVGKIVGFTSEDGAHVWRGIPFAQPPIGDLRWRAPRPGKAWSGTLEALEFGSPCIQYAGLSARREGLESSDTLGSEDCLTLNVFAPPTSPEKIPIGRRRLPVMLWIHGGGNSIGSARLYDASRLAVDQDVVVVTIHYRLGVLGWFAHDAVAGVDATDEDRSGNFGTLDTIAALEWVQEHISAFGGDPDRVTVFGESAGASDTYALLVSPRAAGLFHRAIAQSGSGDLIELGAAKNFSDDPEPGHARSSNEVLLALLLGDTLADTRASDREAGRQIIKSWTPTEISDYLRGKTPTELLALYGDGLGGMYDTPKLIRDGVVLPKLDPRESFRQGAYNAVPAIFGTNRDEVKLFMAFGSKDVARIGIIPLWFKNERTYNLASEYEAKMWKAHGVDETAAAMTAAGRAPAYAYRFDWDEEGRMLWFDLSRLLGAAHAFEIPFVFGGLSLGPVTDNIFPESSQPAARILSDQMMSYWGQFAYTGNPGRGRGGDLPEWKSWGADPGQFIIFDTEADGGLRLSAETLTRATVLRQISEDDRFETPKERCAVYWDFYRFNDRLSLEEFKTIDGGICQDFEGE